MKTRQLKKNEVKCEYLSEWDDSISIYSPCIVNTVTQKVEKIYKQGREAYDGGDSINANGIEDCVDSLDGEYVYMNGVKYPAYQKEEWDELEDKTGTYYYI